MGTLYVVGIDFGTSNSCVTFATYRGGAAGKGASQPFSPPEPISFDFRDTVPTIIFKAEEGQPPLYGALAEEKLATLPHLTYTGFKMRLGEAGESGREAFELTREYLGYLRSRVAEFVPLDRTDEDHRIETIIGHPVQWSADQREETRRAAEEAGFPNVALEDESLAALYAHLCDDGARFQPELGSRLLLIDMGGGTTDFALLQMPKSPEQRPICRPVDPAPVVPGWGSELTSYGGRDLDQLLLQYLGRDWDAEWMARHCSLLMQEVRRFKEEFSNNVREGIHRHESIWLVGEQHCRISLTREEFEKVAGDYMAHFEALVLGALALAGVTPRQVAAVILAGGHSRWYFVDQTLNGIFPHLSRGAGHLLRHSRPEQSVARGLGYAPMVRGAGAKILAPVRKSAHSFWVYVPYGSPVLQGSGEGTMGRRSQERRPVWDEPVRILPRGHQLPFRTPKPLRIAVNQLGLDAREASVRIQFYSSAGGSSRIPLYERVARFERNPWESLLKRFGTRLPWGKGLDEDQFELLIMCEVDENELLMAELVIIRYFRGKQVALQRQKLQVNNATSSTLPAAAADPPVRQTAPSPA